MSDQDKRYYSSLYCFTYQIEMNENNKGVFKCPSCLLEVCILR